MLQVFVTNDTFQLIGDNLFHILLDASVIRLHRFLHTVITVLVREVGLFQSSRSITSLPGFGFSPKASGFYPQNPNFLICAPFSKAGFMIIDFFA